jgi:hypothetical protein
MLALLWANPQLKFPTKYFLGELRIPKLWVAFRGITFIPNFMKIGQMVQKYNEEQANRHIRGS